VDDVAGEPALVTGDGRALATADGRPIVSNLRRLDNVGLVRNGPVLVFLGGGPDGARRAGDAFVLARPSDVPGGLTELWHVELAPPTK
jgi:hypothetical protein